ncbi:hypothetical protein Ciccas_011295 [Cichlidogyrus casuarinus]|uniref:EF-hand domain-containing protein n=1 Tax=Cichlidogyrus casuarinus TaxID=1844966 RepID=A0ABD2PSV2_9PLAT
MQGFVDVFRNIDTSATGVISIEELIAYQQARNLKPTFVETPSHSGWKRIDERQWIVSQF